MGAVIADWQLPISDWCVAKRANWQSAIENWQCRNPSATADGTDLIATARPIIQTVSLRSFSSSDMKEILVKTGATATVAAVLLVMLMANKAFSQGGGSHQQRTRQAEHWSE